MNEKRKTRKATQHRWNEEKQRHEEYEIDVPVEYTEEEKAGLELQFQRRKDRKKKDDENKPEEVDE